MLKREDGFYWVQLKRPAGKWEPAFWHGGRWEAIGLDYQVDDDEFLKIGARIEPPDIQP